MSLRIVHVVGARPNFMKIAPIVRALSGDAQFDQMLVHTGQHYDPALSAVFLDELGLPAPDVNLGVGSGSHAVQTAEIMQRFDEVLATADADLVLAPGDVNSTLAAALVAAKRGVPVGHVEAGLRSGDLTMPEEVNRILVDRVSSLLFTPSPDADANLLAEGIAPAGIHRVGNLMIDSLVRLLPVAEAGWPRLRAELALDGPYVAVTLHRPVNVDDDASFAIVAAALERIAERIPVVFPMHPRTRARAGRELAGDDRLRVVDPLGYLDFLALEAHAAAVLTDSGGIQEETTVLGVPCLTLREATERPITVTQGTNRLVPLAADSIVAAVDEAIDEPPGARPVPDLWDGRAAERVAAVLRAWAPA